MQHRLCVPDFSVLQYNLRLSDFQFSYHISRRSPKSRTPSEVIPPSAVAGLHHKSPVSAVPLPPAKQSFQMTSNRRKIDVKDVFNQVIVFNLFHIKAAIYWWSVVYNDHKLQFVKPLLKRKAIHMSTYKYFLGPDNSLCQVWQLVF